MIRRRSACPDSTPISPAVNKPPQLHAQHPCMPKHQFEPSNNPAPVQASRSLTACINTVDTIGARSSDSAPNRSSQSNAPLNSALWALGGIALRRIHRGAELAHGGRTNQQRIIEVTAIRQINLNGA